MKRGLILGLVWATACAGPKGDQLQEVLTQVKVCYSTDGCGNSDLLEQPEIQSLLKARSDKMVRDLISFDLLCSILEPTAWFDSDCGDCGIWAAVREPHRITEDEVGLDPARARAAQARWMQLLESGGLKLSERRR